MQIDEAELKALREKTNRHLRLRELLLDHSRTANFVVMTMVKYFSNYVYTLGTLLLHYLNSQFHGVAGFRLQFTWPGSSVSPRICRHFCLFEETNPQFLLFIPKGRTGPRLGRGRTHFARLVFTFLSILVKFLQEECSSFQIILY